MPDSETFARTGINFYIFNTLFQLLSAKGSKAFREAQKFLFVPCYINYLLSGRAVNELTIASTSQMLDVRGDKWDSEILHKLDLEEDKAGQSH